MDNHPLDAPFEPCAVREPQLHIRRDSRCRLGQSVTSLKVESLNSIRMVVRTRRGGRRGRWILSSEPYIWGRWILSFEPYIRICIYMYHISHLHIRRDPRRRLGQPVCLSPRLENGSSQGQNLALTAVFVPWTLPSNLELRANDAFTYAEIARGDVASGNRSALKGGP